MKHLFKYISLVFCTFCLFTAEAQEYGPQKIRYDKDYKKINSIDGSEQTFKDRLIYGGQFGFGFAAGSLRLAVSPTIGYKFNDILSAGVTLGYQYNMRKDYWSLMDINTGAYSYKNLNLHVFSPGLWGRVTFLQNFFVHAEFEYNITSYKEYLYDQNYNVITERISQAVPCLLLGGGIKQPISEKVSYVIYGLYDVLQNTDANSYMQNGVKVSKSPYANTLDIRVGILVGF